MQSKGNFYGIVFPKIKQILKYYEKKKASIIDEDFTLHDMNNLINNNKSDLSEGIKAFRINFKENGFSEFTELDKENNLLTALDQSYILI